MNKRCDVKAISVNALELLDELFLKQVLTECVMMRLRHTAMVSRHCELWQTIYFHDAFISRRTRSCNFWR